MNIQRRAIEWFLALCGLAVVLFLGLLVVQPGWRAFEIGMVVILQLVVSAFTLLLLGLAWARNVGRPMLVAAAAFGLLGQLCLGLDLAFSVEAMIPYDLRHAWYGTLFGSMLIGGVVPVVVLLEWPILRGRLHLVRRAAQSLAMAWLLLIILAMFADFPGGEEEWAFTLTIIGLPALLLTMATPALAWATKSEREITRESIHQTLHIRCPRCLAEQAIEAGRSRCRQCRLIFHIEVEEPRCPGCAYLLHELTRPVCPECGRQLAAEEVAPLLPASDTAETGST